MNEEKLWEKILTKICYFGLFSAAVAAIIWTINNDNR